MRLSATGWLVAVGVLALAGPALASSSVASAWGRGNYGDLGNGYHEGSEYANSPVPVEVQGLTGVRSVAAGGADSLALLEDGTVDAWGENSFGQLGNGTEMDSDVPVAVSGLSGVTAITAGRGNNLALLGNGKVMAWGWNSSGQLGIGTTTNSDVPVEIKGLSGVTAVAAGYDHSLALLSDGTVMAWGTNQVGELGDGTTGEGSDVPVAVSGLNEVAAIAAGYSYSLALLKNGTVMAWGDGEQGELGTGASIEHSDVPVAVCAVGETAPCSHDLSGVRSVSAKGPSLALLSNGTVVAWGGGDLGDGSEAGSDVPVKVSGLSAVQAISGSMALLSDGTVMAWGTNLEGELGDPSAGKESLVPVPVSGLSEVTAISDGAGHSLAAGAPPVRFPQVLEVGPRLGAGGGGTTVTITGFGFTGVKAVKFGATDAKSFDVESENKITAVSPAGSGTVDVTVETAAGTSPTVRDDEFDYAPSVYEMQPHAGFPAGGTTVTITGTNFNEVSAVKFGSTNAASFEVLSESKIKAVSPPGTDETTVDVTVETRGGANPSESDHFTFTDVPGISSVTPNHGPPSGGTKVTITGSSFTGATEVHFGSTEAKSFKVESETEITAVSPTFSGGDASMPIFVTSPGGTNEYECGEEQVGFIYEPIVTSVEPNSGPSAGGTQVTIKGADFEGAIWFKVPLCTLETSVVSWVDFGSTPAKSVNVVSESEITAVAPPGAGMVDVTVTSRPAGHSPLIPGDQFSYTAPPLIQEPKTEAATSVTSTLAILEGTLEPAGAKLKYDFQYNAGASCEGGGTTPEAEGEDRVSTKVEGLTPNTKYTFCLIAKSTEGGTAAGRTETFRTLESQAEREAKEAKEKTEAEAKAKVEAEAKAKGEAEAKAEAETAAATKKHQEEEAAAKKKTEEAATTGSVSLDGSVITVQDSGEAQVKLACTGTGTCSGKLTLTVKARGKDKHKHSKTTIIGTATFSIWPGKTATVELELNARVRALLSSNHGRLSAMLTVLKASPAPSQTHADSVQLVQRRAHGKTKK